MCTVHVEIGPGCIEVVATDGNRLAAEKRALSTGKHCAAYEINLAPAEADALVTRRPSGFLELAEGRPAIATVNSPIYEGAKTKDAQGKDVDVQFPDWRHLVPTWGMGQITFSNRATRKLRATVRKTCKREVVTDRLTFDYDALTIQPHGTDKLRGLYNLPLAEPEKLLGRSSARTAFVLYFNPRYLRDALSSIPSSDVIIEYGNHDFDPIVIRNEDRSSLRLIMPMKE